MRQPALPRPAPRPSPRLGPRLAGALLALAAAWAGPAAAQGLSLDTRLVASGLTQPLYATAPLADGRVFIVEKGGTIKVSLGGVVSTFLSFPVATASEQGLLGLAFDPGYADATSPGYRRFFVDYIDPTTQNTVIASYRSTANPSLADPASRVEILRVEQPAGFTNHKAGWIGFKPGDANNLYIATGDGGSGNDPGNRAQNTGLLLGKMLRIDINRDDFASPTLNYGIPLDNPFVGQAGARGEIFALGLRNPYRSSFDRLTGNLWIGDVGQSAREEIDFIAATSPGGQNFGWRQREGRIATPGISDPPTAGLIDPVLDYPRSIGGSVIGGYVVRDAASPLYGKYVFGDYISRRFFAIDGSGTAGDQFIGDAIEITALINAGASGAIGSLSSFGEGAGGELFIVDIGGRVVQVVPEPGTLALWLAGLGVMVLRRRRG